MYSTDCYKCDRYHFIFNAALLVKLRLNNIPNSQSHTHCCSTISHSHIIFRTPKNEKIQMSIFVFATQHIDENKLDVNKLMDYVYL